MRSFSASGSTAPILTSASSAARAMVGAAERPHHAGAGDQRDDFITCEHQRRKVETLPHHVADAGLAIDRNAGRLQVGDVAVDRALGNFEPLRRASAR